MAAKRPRQARENVTEIRSAGVRGGERKFRLKMASRRPIRGDSPNSNTPPRPMPPNRFSAPIPCSGSTAKSC